MHVPRLRRRSFWLASIAAWVLFYAVRELAGLSQPGWPAAIWAAFALLGLALLAVARLHDRGRSGWWLASALLPVLGAAWLAWELALRRGNPHANLHGPDPLEH